MTPRTLDPDPFSDFNCLPLGFYLDPEEWLEEAFRPRTSVRRFKRLPTTARFAKDLAAQLSRGTWGEEHDRGWTTLVAGKTRQTRFKVECIGLLTHKELLRAFVRLDRHGLGTRDRFDPAWLSVSAEAEWPHVSCIRFDIDLDQVFASEDLEGLVEVGRACLSVGQVVQLPCSVMTTGRRGVQAHFSLPARLATADARSVRDALHAHLAKTLPSWAVLDKDSVDHLLRLPLTRHAKTHRLALYIGVDGQVLPVEEQIECTLRTFTPTGIESEDELKARFAELKPTNQPGQTAPVRVPSTAPNAYGPAFRGARHDYWSSLIEEPLVAGRTWEYLSLRGGVYAHVARFGKEVAKKRLREKVLDMPYDGKVAERLYKVERLVGTCDIRAIEPSEFSEFAFTDADVREVDAYVKELQAEGVRHDCIYRQEMVFGAWLVAERLYGPKVTGAKIARVVGRLYGAAAPTGKSVYRALDMLREKDKIWFVTLKERAVANRVCGGYLTPLDLA